MRPHATRTWWWLLAAVVLGVLAWLDDGGSSWGISWRAGLVAVGIVAAVAAVRTHSSALLAIAVGAVVLRIGLVQHEIPVLP